MTKDLVRGLISAVHIFTLVTIVVVLSLVKNGELKDSALWIISLPVFASLVCVFIHHIIMMQLERAVSTLRDVVVSTLRRQLIRALMPDKQPDEEFVSNASDENFENWSREVARKNDVTIREHLNASVLFTQRKKNGTNLVQSLLHRSQKKRWTQTLDR